MSKKPDSSFQPDNGLQLALDLLRNPPQQQDALPKELPESGIDEPRTLHLLAPHVISGAAPLAADTTLANMDPPTPWITWAMSLWNASLNQNLLHPATAPFAIEAERKVIEWLAPLFGMNGGHMCGGSTLANLTALWVARDSMQVERVVASVNAHNSIAKAAKILGLPYEQIRTRPDGQFDLEHAGDLSNTCLVLTAGTTATGTIEPLELIDKAGWGHIDAAWAGPLLLSRRYAQLLAGIDKADSVSVSAHKWLFQPKDSAFIFFKAPETAEPAISYGGGYLSAPNIGIQGSRGAAAIPLLATMIAWGSSGMAARIDHTMDIAHQLAAVISTDQNLQLWGEPASGVVVFRPNNMTTDELDKQLPDGMFSLCEIDNNKWLRSVAANPLADIGKIITCLKSAVAGT